MSHHRQRELQHFLLLTLDEQHEAIRRMASQGLGDNIIAGATGLSVDMVRRVIGPRKPQA